MFQGGARCSHGSPPSSTLAPLPPTGLPIIATLQHLIGSGDRIERIEGIFSGTLSYIFNNFGKGAPGLFVVYICVASGWQQALSGAGARHTLPTDVTPSRAPLVSSGGMRPAKPSSTASLTVQAHPHVPCPPAFSGPPSRRRPPLQRGGGGGQGAGGPLLPLLLLAPLPLPPLTPT